MNIPSFLSNVDWKTIMGALRNQTDHVVCWSIVISELIRAIRLICQRETDENILYSPQDMIDFVDPQMRRTIRENHYCYPNSLKNGLNYVRDNGIQREEDRPFIGCSADQPDSYRNPANLTFTKRHKTAHSIDQMFGALKEGPIGASLAIFQPEFRKREKEMYRGAESPSSRLVSSHSVSIAAVGEENGERFAWVRSSEGDEVGHSGYYKVSLDAFILHLPRVGENIAPLNRRFSKPSPVLANFVYPILLTREEEEEKRKNAMLKEERKRKNTSLDRDEEQPQRKKPAMSGSEGSQAKNKDKEAGTSKSSGDAEQSSEEVDAQEDDLDMDGFIAERDAGLAAYQAERAKNDRMSGPELFLSNASLSVDDAEAFKEYQSQKEEVVETEQKYVQSLKQSVQPEPDASKAAAKKKKDEEKAREAELNELFKVAISEPKVPVGVGPKSILCEFFKTGQCENGFKCKFSHDLNIPRKGQKIDIYSDQRDEDGGMEDWDQETLEKVVESNKNEYSNQNKPTDILAMMMR